MKTMFEHSLKMGNICFVQKSLYPLLLQEGVENFAAVIKFSHFIICKCIKLILLFLQMFLKSCWLQTVGFKQLIAILLHVRDKVQWYFPLYNLCIGSIYIHVFQCSIHCLQHFFVVLNSFYMFISKCHCSVLGGFCCLFLAREINIHF